MRTGKGVRCAEYVFTSRLEEVMGQFQMESGVFRIQVFKELIAKNKINRVAWDLVELVAVVNDQTEIVGGRLSVAALIRYINGIHGFDIACDL